ncbi:MAG: hypothetical protein IIX89_03695 [Oscillospiraceae bacterium]|nr:hypothetical protein [Oscillospiraceae bacterium]
MAEIKEIRNAMRKKKRNRTARRICIVVILLALVVAIIVNRDNLTPDAISNWLSGSLSAEGSEEGFPVNLPSGETVSLMGVSENVALTTQTNVYFYSPRGREIRSLQHSCKGVQTKAGGDNLLLYSVGGNKILVETKSKNMVSAETENKIITGEISRNGRFAIATESDVYTSEMTVYDKAGNAVFKWTPSGSVITSLALSEDGRRVAAATVFTEGGVLMTGVHLFETGKSEALFSYRLKDEIAVSLEVNKNSVRVISSSAVTDISEKGELLQSFGFGGKKLKCKTECDGNSVLVFEDVNDPSKSTIEIVNNKTVIKAQASVSKAVLSVASDGKDIYAIADDEIMKFSSNTAVKTGSLAVEHGAERLAASSAGAFVINSASELLRPELD